MTEYLVTHGTSIPGRHNFKSPTKPFHLSSPQSSITEYQLWKVPEITSSNTFILQMRN